MWSSWCDCAIIEMDWLLSSGANVKTECTSMFHDSPIRLISLTAWLYSLNRLCENCTVWPCEYENKPAAALKITRCQPHVVFPWILIHISQAGRTQRTEQDIGWIWNTARSHTESSLHDDDRAGRCHGAGSCYEASMSRAAVGRQCGLFKVWPGLSLRSDDLSQARNSIVSLLSATSAIYHRNIHTFK